MNATTKRSIESEAQSRFYPKVFANATFRERRTSGPSTALLSDHVISALLGGEGQRAQKALYLLFASDRGGGGSRHYCLRHYRLRQPRPQSRLRHFLRGKVRRSPLIIRAKLDFASLPNTANSETQITAAERIITHRPPTSYRPVMIRGDLSLIFV